MIYKTLNPVWEESFFFCISTKSESSVIFKVFDKDFLFDDFIGSAKIDCKDIPNGKSKRILKLASEYQQNRSIELTISSAKPPIFWKDKEIIKRNNRFNSLPKA